MDSSKDGPSKQGSGKGKILVEKRGKRAGKVKRKAFEGKGVGDEKWNPSDPLPDSPTPLQIKAHNDALLDAYAAELLPERDLARGWASSPMYEELLRNYRYAQPEAGLPEGAESRIVPKDDLECPSESSSDSSECSSEESEEQSEDSDSDSQY